MMPGTPQVNIEDFINKHLVKVFYAIIIYFVMGLSADFKDVKITLQQLLVNQATVDNRLTNLESRAQRNSDRLDRHDNVLLDVVKEEQLKTTTNK